MVGKEEAVHREGTVIGGHCKDPPKRTEGYPRAVIDPMKK
jgi:hypothetical protein